MYKGNDIFSLLEQPIINLLAKATLDKIYNYENRSEDEEIDNDFYYDIYESEIFISDEIWKIIFDIIKANKAK